MELASAIGTSTVSAAATPSGPSSPMFTSPDGHHSTDGNQTDGLADSPLILPGTREIAEDIVPELMLDKAAVELDQERKKTV